MTTTFFSSDWHLGHARIIELCNRPFKSTIAMNRTIIERCNDTVTEKDNLVLLGDNAMGTYADNVKLLTQIRARRIYFLPGNHDRWSLAYARSDAKRDEARKYLESLDERFRVFADNKPSAWCHKIGEHDVVLSHFPYAGDSQEQERHADLRPADHGLPLVHGHVHEKWKQNGHMLNVGVDVWDFAPVPEEAVLAFVASSTAS